MKVTHDLMSNLTSLTDAEGRTTSFAYDVYKRVTKVTYPGGAFESFTYDSASRLKTKTDRKNIVTTYMYDDVGRLLSKTYSDGTPEVTYQYDKVGRLTHAANGTDTLDWVYDLVGQLVSEQSAKNSSVVAYTYDLAGNRLSVSLDGQVFVTYGYDDASRLTTITRGTNVFGFGYDVANRRTSMTYPNGVATSYAYDNLDRLLRMRADKGAAPITDFQYTYDNAGNRTRKQQLDYTEDYAYDPLYRLTGATRTGENANRWVWGYDKVGNRLAEQVGNTVTSSTYNEKNQLLSRTGGGPMRWRGTLSEPGHVTFTSATVNGKPARMLPGNVFEAQLDMPVGDNTVTLQATDVNSNITTQTYQVNVTGEGASYTYDANGNLATKVEGGSTWVYEWSAENKLVRVIKDGAEVARFFYDPKGRRVEKVAGGITTTWAYDGEDILREITGGMTVRYVLGPGIDEPLARDTAGMLTFFHADGLGSGTRVTDGAGVVTFTRQYDAWGNFLAGAGDGGTAFTGREWDPEIGLAYYRARYYNSKIGRFISEDPLGSWIVEPYGYVRGRPTHHRDPSGLLPKIDPSCGGRKTEIENALMAVCDPNLRHANALSKRKLPDACSQVDSIKCTCDEDTCTEILRWTLPDGRIILRKVPAYGSAPANTPGGPIYLCPLAFGPDPILKQTILHELMHTQLPDSELFHRQIIEAEGAFK